MHRPPSRFALAGSALVAGIVLAACATSPDEATHSEVEARTSEKDTSRFEAKSPPEHPAADSGKQAHAIQGHRGDAGSAPHRDVAPSSSPRPDRPDASRGSDDPRPGNPPAPVSGKHDPRKPAVPDPTETDIAPALPSGNEPVFQDRRMVALYGTPSTPALGAVGEQSLGKSIERVKKLARSYGKYTEDDVVPTFELIASVASTSAGDDGDFSSELPMSTLRPWIERAADEGVYIVLDLQPGRTDFLSQAKRFAPLLKYPHVGLALDPEWRLGPKQRHLEQIGSVHGTEVNATIDWLARLTEREDLPQKLVVLHQFRTSMIEKRGLVRADRDNVTVLVHADGQGSQAAKRGTWRVLHKGAPPAMKWGWKNFIDEDHPMLTPKQTYRVRPKPHFVSYQ